MEPTVDIFAPASFLYLLVPTGVAMALGMMLLYTLWRRTQNNKGPSEFVLAMTIMVPLFGFIAGGSTLAIQDATLAKKERTEVTEAIYDAYNVTELIPHDGAFELCKEKSPATADSYIWVTTDGESETGIVKKSAEENGECSYELIPLS